MRMSGSSEVQHVCLLLQQVFSEPAPVPAQPLAEGQSFTIWDRWEVRGSEATTVVQFMAELTVR